MIRSLASLLRDLPQAAPPPRPPEARRFALPEIAEWLLPMAPEHLRRTLAADPALPQGSQQGQGGSRWFTAPDLAGLRAAFEARAPGRYALPAPKKALTLAGPLGRPGRSTVAAHLAVAAALGGLEVLLVEADPAGGLAGRLGAEAGPKTGSDTGLDTALAAKVATALRRLNAERVDRGAQPVPLPADLAGATAGAAVPTRWPGLSLIPAGPGLADLDARLVAWERLVPGWTGGAGMARLVAGWRDSHDLVLIDPGPGLGPLALACLSAAPLLLPVPPGARAGEGMQALERVLERAAQARAERAAALGEAPPERAATGGLILPVERTGTPPVAGDLPPFPDLTGLIPEGGTFWDLDHRGPGKAAWTPPRAALDRLIRALTADLAGD